MAVQVRVGSGFYIGEKRKEKRNGQGVYVYENKYYRYEGDWKNGKKHGHGKLLMKDGSHYEGQFHEGEITGNGYRYFHPSQNKYSGHFVRGELHGKGKMIYKDGTIYEGDWLNNRKHGFGVMTTLRNDYYEGGYYHNRRHGDGKMDYSNGDRYVGQWASDKRQGHGELRCADGSVYTGTFGEDMFHGSGVMIHGSGFIYDGQWIQGWPEKIATKIVIVSEKTPMIARQGRPFDIRIECRDDNDEVVPDQGRELSIQAGFKHFPPKEGSALFDMIEDVEDKPIKTPFDYDVVPYPLSDNMNVNEDLQQQGEEEDKDEDLTMSKSQSQLTLNNELTEIEDPDDDKDTEKGDEITEVECEASVTNLESSMSFVDGSQTRENTEIPQDSETTNGVNPQENGVSPRQPEKESTTMPPPVTNKRSERGVCIWKDLQLAPAPPMYRPFVAMEEAEAEASNTKRTRSRSKAPDLPVKGPAGANSKRDPSPGGPHVSSCSNQHYVRRRSSGAASTALIGQTLLDRFRKEKEKNLEEQYAKIGEYVIMVHDVTNPPFLGRRLEPAFLLVKLKRPLKEKKKTKPKWDTKSHIIEAMRRQEGDP